MTPIPDTSRTGHASGIYETVRRALEDDLSSYRWTPPAIIGDTLAAMANGERVSVPGWALPNWLRSHDWPEPMAVIAPDDQLEFRPETGEDLCRWLGI